MSNEGMCMSVDLADPTGSVGLVALALERAEPSDVTDEQSAYPQYATAVTIESNK